ncbi:MAG: RNA polymerase sigma factor [Pirellulaceae bacterium]
MKDQQVVPNSWREAEPTDEHLLVAYRKLGDREAFARLVHRYERELYSYLRRYLGDAEMAEDAFQATFLQIHLKCDQFEEGRAFRPWMYTIATNQAIDAQRRNRRHRMVSLDRSSGHENDLGTLIDLLVSGDDDPVVSVGQAERRQLVQEMLEQLPEYLRVVIQLVYYQGLKYREAADVLDVPVGTVKSRVHTAILKLTEIWKQAHADRE